MTGKSSSTKKATQNHVNHQNTLEQWLETTADFHAYYTRLIDCLRNKMTAKKLSGTVHDPLSRLIESQLVDLVRVMEVELEILLLDMDHVDAVTPSDRDKAYRKLDRHTRLLRKLNQQANNVLLLTTLTGKNIGSEMTDQSN